MTTSRQETAIASEPLPDDAARGRIVVDRLTKTFGGQVRAVDQLTFTVEPGSITGFLGPNGAGKTTTLRMVLGLVRPSSGQATIGGKSYRQLSSPLRTVGAALESSSFHPARTARSHLLILCVVAGLPARRADEVLEKVGLHEDADRKVRDYSLGMRQRLELAQAMVGDPAVLILDEPANGLDPDGIRWLRTFLRELAAEGRTVLVSSHQLNEVQEVADRIVILNKGRLVRSGSIAELAAGTDRVIVRTPTPEPLQAALSAQRADVSPVGRDVMRVRGLSAERVGHVAFSAGIELHQLVDEHLDLEELFFTLTGDQAGPRPTDHASSLGGAR